MHSIIPPQSTLNHFLPDFRSLVIQGNYPASAPIHLCLSHLSSGVPAHKPLLVASSNRYLSSELEDFNDAWLTEHSGEGAIAERLHQIDIFYPPTHGHLRLLLDRLRTHSTPMVDADSETDLKTCISRAPTLLVLHELSRYFLDPQLSGDSDIQGTQLPTLSTYMQLVIDTIASLQFLSRSARANPPRLVIFDKQLHNLVLPIYRPIDIADIDRIPKQHKARVTDALQRYIEWVGTIEKVEDEEIISSQADEIDISGEEVEDKSGPDKAHFRMLLCKSPHTTAGPGVSREQTLEWVSYRDPYEPQFTLRRRTVIVPVAPGV